MKPLFKCELSYLSSPHLSQIYDGFEKLRKNGIVDITVKSIKGDATKPLLKVKVDNKYTVIYDTLDGFNWINGSIKDNLNYFKSIQADFYFKRSYNNQLIENSPKDCKVYPLGLNYELKAEGIFSIDLKETIKSFFKKNDFILRTFKLNKDFYSKDFEFYPIPLKENKILFLTRLWNPDDVSLELLKIEREKINKSRIDCIKACQKEFGKKFLGGVQMDEFSIHHSKELIMPFYLTKRDSFLNAIKEHNICIATTGLHDSIGWKFGEYVASSRAIISEPLKYDVPGKFENEKNYFIFKNEDELMNKIHFLLKNKDELFEIMKNNFQYYNNYLRSDVLVLNTLLKMYQNY